MPIFSRREDAFERGDRVKLDALAAPFAGHLLEPYVAYWQLKLGLDTATRDDVRALSGERWPDTPLADRLRVDWLKIARQARRLDARSRSTTRRRPARTPSSRATASSFAASATATPRWRRRSRCGSPGQATPDACEPLFAALVAQRHAHAGRPPRAFPAGRRGRQRPRRAGDRRRSFRRRTGSPRANSRRSSATRRGRSRRATSRGSRTGGRELALYALERAARTDAAAARAAWVRQRAAPARGRSRATATRGSPSTRRGSSPRRRTTGSAKRGGAPLDRSAARMARARGAARGAWPDVLRGDRRDAGGAGAGAGVALLARARAGRRRARRRGECALRDARAGDAFLRHSRGRSARPAGCRPVRERAAQAERQRSRTHSPRTAALARRSARAGGAARGQARGARHAAGVAARMDLRRARTRRRRPAGRRRIRAAPEALRPRDQHGRAHGGAPRFRAALPDAVPRATSRRPRATHEIDPAILLGIARQESRFVRRHRVVGRRGRA